MEKKGILGRVDHTLLKQTATQEQIEALRREGVECAAASVCIPPCYVKRAKKYTEESLATCMVIGFPGDNMTAAAKMFEAEDAVEGGAGEIDMVINIRMVKGGLYEQILKEIRQIEAVCAGKCLKAIVGTCLLTENEKKGVCHVIAQSGADYIRTSTGFSIGGATREDVALLREHSGPRVKAKATGGIASLQGVEDLIALGVDRLGTSRLVP